MLLESPEHRSGPGGGNVRVSVAEAGRGKGRGDERRELLLHPREGGGQATLKTLQMMMAFDYLQVSLRQEEERLWNALLRLSG